MRKNIFRTIFLMILIPNLSYAGCCKISIPSPAQIVNNVVTTVVDAVNDTATTVADAAQDTVHTVADAVSDTSNTTNSAARYATKKVEHIYAANITLLSDYGRYKACLATLCASEYIRNKELKELTTSEHDNFIKDIAAYDTLKRKDVRDYLENQIALHKEEIAKVKIEKQDKELIVNAKRNLLAAIDANFKLRQDCRDSLINYEEIRMSFKKTEIKQSSINLQDVLDNPNTTDEQLSEAFLNEIISAAENDQLKNSEMINDLVLEIDDASISRLKKDITQTLALEEQSLMTKSVQLTILELSLGNYEARLSHVPN